MSVSREQRHTKWHRCPVCGGAEQDPRGIEKRCNGFTSEDGEWIHCSREEFAGALSPNSIGLYVHKTHGQCNCGITHNPTTSIIYKSNERTYDYTDESGRLLFQVVRKPGKKFLQRRPDGNGGWEWKLNGVRRVLYKLPEILASSHERVVYLVEGERDVETLSSRGYLATCNPGGAGKWPAVADCAATVLKDRMVVIIADADEVGRKHALQIADALEGIALSLSITEPPSPAKDVTEMYENGLSLEHLISIQNIVEPPPFELCEVNDVVSPKEEDSVDFDQQLANYITAEHTDVRNAEKLLEWYGENIKYCSVWNKWLSWDGKRWNIDDLGQAQHFAIETSRRMFAEAEAAYNKAVAAKKAVDDNSDASDFEKKKAAFEYKKAKSDLSHAESTQSSARINSMLILTRSYPQIAVSPAMLNKDPMLLTVANGTVDLKTGEISPHRRDDLITRLAPVHYDPTAQCPTWLAFLKRSMGSDDLVEYLQRVTGYAVSGDIREHIITFFYGTGANGKSTFLSTIHRILGDYGGPAARGLLFKKRSGAEQHPTELANLYGKRFVTCSEIQEGQLFDEALVKDLTGGDPISCRRMREDFWSFDPTHKFFLAGNHKPSIRGDDEGIWRRIRLIPWTVTIPEAERDPLLPKKVLEESSGILTWLVQGCIKWQNGGLSVNESVSKATSGYKVENDFLGQFIEDCLFFEKSARVARFQLRNEYETFCSELGIEPVGPRRLAARLKEHGVEATTIALLGFDQKTFNAWKGVRLKTPEERKAVDHIAI